MDWLTVVVTDPVRAMLIRVWGYIPTIAGALLILVIGWLIAKFAEVIVVKILKISKLDIAAEKGGIARVLAQGDVRFSLSEIVGMLIYWVVILITVVTMLSALNLREAANLLARLVEYVPNVVAAVFVIVLGSFLANILGTVVKTASANAGIANGKFLGQVTQIILVVFAIAIAIEQLKIATELIGMALYIILASIGIAIGLAFGLGCKDIAGKAMQNFLDKMKK